MLSLPCSLYLDGSIQVGLFDAQHNLPGDSDAIEKVVDETHVVYEGVNVTGAQHQQSGDQLNMAREDKVIISDHTVRTRGPDMEDRNVVVFLFRTHSKQQGWDWSAARDVNHGQQTWEVAFSRSGEKQPERQKQRRSSPESRASWCTAERTAQETHSSRD